MLVLLLMFAVFKEILITLYVFKAANYVEYDGLTEIALLK